MIRSILLALAEAPHEESARNYAFWLARKAGSRIQAISIIDLSAFDVPVLSAPDGFVPSVVAPPLQENQRLIEELSSAAKERLDQFAQQCSSRGIPVSTEVRTGIPGDAIGRAAVAHDIIVLSRTGYSRIANTKESVDPLVAPVVRASPRPVLVAGSEFREESDIRRILVAYDGSSHSARSLLVAAELAARPEVHCTLATVAPSEESGQRMLAPAEEFLSHHGVRPTTVVKVSSKPSDMICGLVASGGFDIVVMGAYGHSPIREVLFGSTTERVLAHCATSVVLQS